MFDLSSALEHAMAGGAASFSKLEDSPMTTLEGLTLEQVISRIRNGQPLHWFTVRDSNGDVYDMAAPSKHPYDIKQETTHDHYSWPSNA